MTEENKTFFEEHHYGKWCEKMHEKLEPVLKDLTDAEFISKLHSQIAQLHLPLMLTESAVYGKENYDQVKRLITKAYVNYETLQCMLEVWHKKIC